MTIFFFCLAVAAVAATVAGAKAVLRRQRLIVENLRRHVRRLEESAAARDRAEASSEAKSRFLATVSHEIRTPLAGIIGLAELLADSSLNGEQRAHAEAIKTSGAALESLIDEILDFSKIEAGKIELAREPIVLSRLLEGVAELLGPRAHGKGLEIATFVDPGLPPRIVGDEARLRQVLMNLAGNAVKFTERGGLGIRVAAAEAGKLLFEVADTGPGVPEDKRSAIFNEFEQGDVSMTRRHGGTGLGLAISKRLVAMMNGDMTLHSIPGHGSVFGFTIPLAQPGEPAKSQQDECPALNHLTALIVARSSFEAPYLGALLRARGATVIFAADAAQVQAQLESAAPLPDVMLVDWALGTEASAAAVLAREFNIRRRLILFSPFERRAFGQASTNDFSGWLVKPVRAASLFARLADTQEPQPIRQLDPAAVPQPETGLRVLFAEDDEINALIARAFLARLGADTTYVSDGAAALALAREAIAGEREPFDLGLMDIRMPLLDGLEVARAVRRAEAAAGVPPMRLVALTANAFAEDRSACLDAGFDAVLMKPVDAAAFRLALGKGEKPAADPHAGARYAVESFREASL